MARRASRKRGHRARPARQPAARASQASRTGEAPAPSPARKPPRPRSFAPTGEQLSRSQRRDAEARARLTPLSPGERPPVIVVSALVAAGLALANLVSYLAGLKVGGSRPAASEIAVFSGIMLACAAGLWRLWYGAVLGFMALLAIIVTAFALLLIEASNVLGAVVALVVIALAGYLFYKLVRVLSRIQMPQRPSR